jgi:metallo-beta-lactamase class B
MKTMVLLLFIFFSITELKASNYPKVYSISNNIELIQLSEYFYIHKTYTFYEFGQFSSNGVIVVKNGKVLMIDTPISIEDTKKIVSYINDSLQASLVKFIGSHYHNDCIGGMAYLNEKNVVTILNEKTKQICIEKNLPLPDKTFNKNLSFNFEGIDVECYYFGGGHTVDNIVVYFPYEQLLFGGCLVKSSTTQNMGNTADATPKEWAKTLKKVQASFKDVELVIPGHGDYGTSELIDHTIDLAEKFFGEN